MRIRLSPLLGTFTWTSPYWLNMLRKKSRQSPGLFWSITGLLVLLIGAAAYGTYWYKHLPKPVYTVASITVPPITPNAETLVPNNLVIDFGIKSGEFTPESVAPISNIGKPVTEGIEITPHISGQWFWNSDSQLVFTPDEDWPADQTFTIHCKPDFFTTKAHFESLDFSFSTLPFQAAITDFKFYQDPVNTETRNAVATIQFNYPVDPESLEKNTSLMFQGLTVNNQNIKPEPVSFSYTYDAHKRVAWLKSENIKITDAARYMLLTLNKDVSSSTGSGHINEAVSKNLLIPDSSGFLRVISASASILRNDQDKPEQVLTVETSLGVNEKDFNPSIHVYLLPEDYPATPGEKAKPNYPWQNPGEVTDAILALSTPLKKQAIPTEYNYSPLHSFKFTIQTPRYLYIKIDKGMKGFGGFILSNDYTAVIAAPELPKEISFLHKGALLAMGGEKKLSVMIRGVPAVKFDFARVLPDNINQLVTQTKGDFNNPYFINPSFNQQNISQIFTDIQQFDASDSTRQQYTALDFSKYLTADASNPAPGGLFLLQATGWDVTNNAALDVKASRLILITDLGMLVKDNNNDTHDVFVQSITQGVPVANVQVAVLGKNGLPVITRMTDDQGRANFPSLRDFIDDREPVVYVATLGQDVSFIPFANDGRRLNYSRFDTGGVYSGNQDAQSLSAFLFSDRGTYRPGDTAHIGMIVKQAWATAATEGLPLQATVIDSRGTTIKDVKLALDKTGYMDLDFATSPTSPTGQYTVNLYLVKDKLSQNLLGSTTVNVYEFQPDRMRITSSMLPAPAEGWSAPAGLKAHINLWNLYGAPAADRRISAKILLTPERVEFTDYPNYVFADPLIDPKKPARVFTETLADLKTNDKGEAEFDLNLERFEKATYQLTFFAEGFESEGGRSVTTQSRVLISPLPWFIGYKADGDLSFIKQHAARSVNYIAINPKLDKTDVTDLNLQLVSLHPVTTLVKNPDGTCQYQSIMQSTVVNTTPFTIGKQGTDYTLPSDTIGNFALNILDKNNTVLSQLKFSIVGASQSPMAKNAELDVKLNKEQYQANDDIELQITAPYTGSGLITIERDKVYASQWFKTDTTNSVQKIHIPADFQGNGYVNVAFIRDWTSPELFISPLSYSVIPFEMNHDSHAIKIALKTPEVAKPGEPFTIDYQTDKPGKIIVFAIDEGILQVGRYETPDPLAFFFQKQALEVLTQQTLDQILPEFIQARELSAAGGDGNEEALAARINPFKRKTDLPVAYWSGIIDTDNTSHQLTWQVPDYFNGTMRVMAVAVSPDSVGSTDTSARIRGDFIINPNVPTFVAPGDKFEISASIANNIKGSGEHASVTVELTVTPELELVSNARQTLEIAEGHEQTVHYTLRAKSLPGAATLEFTTSSGDKSGKISASTSVRPATPYTTYIHSGMSQDAQKSLDVLQTLYPEYRTVDATLSTSPMILVFGLQRYLDNFPYGCTEQLTSKALPLLAMNIRESFAKDTRLINEKVNTTIQMLGQRQMSNGGFSYWPGTGDNQGNSFASVYAMNFLTEARAQGFNVPDSLFFNAISYLKDLASQNPADLDAARVQAYAIYILTRNEIVTSNYLANLQRFLQQDKSGAWKKDITGVYIAASYQMLKSFTEANELINQYNPQGDVPYNTDFYDKSIANAQYMYILAKNFPDLLKQKGDTLLMTLVQSINNDEINTVLSGSASLALGAYQHNNPEIASPALSITATLLDNKEKSLPATDPAWQQVSIEPDAKTIHFNNPDKQTVFYQLMQAGFDKQVPTEPVQQGLEIYREYRDAQGATVTTTALGSEIEVHIHIRAVNHPYLTNIAIEDLLPGGFEVVRDSVKPAPMDYSDIREDRVNFFGSADSTAKEIVYKIKAVNPGKYTVPPVYAEAMYNPDIKARGTASGIVVTDGKQ